MQRVVFFSRLQEIEYNSRDEMMKEEQKDCQIPIDNDSVVDNYSPKKSSKIINCPENFLLFTLSQGEFVLKNKWGLFGQGSSLSHNFFPKKIFPKNFYKFYFYKKNPSSFLHSKDFPNLYIEQNKKTNFTLKPPKKKEAKKKTLYLAYFSEY